MDKVKRFFHGENGNRVSATSYLDDAYTKKYISMGGEARVGGSGTEDCWGAGSWPLPARGVGRRPRGESAAACAGSRPLPARGVGRCLRGESAAARAGSRPLPAGGVSRCPGGELAAARAGSRPLPARGAGRCPRVISRRRLGNSALYSGVPRT